LYQYQTKKHFSFRKNEGFEVDMNNGAGFHAYVSIKKNPAETGFFRFAK